MDHPTRERLWALGKGTFRAIGTMTASARPAPDFVIIGTKRGGTTSLYRHMLQHPAVMPMFPSARRLPLKKDIKAVRYFDSGFHRSFSWYRGHFPTRASRMLASRRVGGRVVSGEASPYYLFHPLAAERAGHLIPTTKVIILLRNPIDRAFSHYKERRREGIEKLSFEEAIEEEPLRLAGEEERLRADPYYYSYAHEHLSYVAQSLYSRSVARWQRHFSQSSMLVIRSEDLYENGVEVVARVLNFIGLEQAHSQELPKLNATSRSSMEPATRAKLAERFAPDVRELESTLGVELDWHLESG